MMKYSAIHICLLDDRTFTEITSFEERVYDLIREIYACIDMLHCSQKNQFATELLLCVIWMPKSNLSEKEQLTKQVFFFVIHHTSKRWFQYSQGRTCPWPLYKLSALPKHLIINSVIDFWGCKYDNAEYDAHRTCPCIQNGWRWNAPSYHTKQCLICKHG